MLGIKMSLENSVKDMLNIKPRRDDVASLAGGRVGRENKTTGKKWWNIEDEDEGGGALYRSCAVMRRGE
jgi:hypothetical protein